MAKSNNLLDLIIYDMIKQLDKSTNKDTLINHIKILVDERTIQQNIELDELNELMSQNENILAQNTKLLARNMEILTKNKDFLSQNTELLTQNNELLFQNKELLTQNNEFLIQKTMILAQKHYVDTHTYNTNKKLKFNSIKK